MPRIATHMLSCAACVIGLGIGLAVVSGCADSRSAHTDERSAMDDVPFEDVTEEAGLGDYAHENGGVGKKWMPEIVGPGAAFIDYDGDGWQDILIVGGGVWEDVSDDTVRALWLYRNEGDGTFSLRTDGAGLGEVDAYGFGVSVADYDNDGDQDFFLTTLSENMLFRNEGGTFEEVGAASGVSDEALWSTSALFFDADRDGWVDLFVGNYVAWSPSTDIPCYHNGEKGYCTPQSYTGVPSTFYRNNGDGTFTNATKEAGFAGAIEPALDKTLGVTELDFNNDGWSDLYVAIDTERNLLFQNDGDGTFTEVGVRSGVAYDQNGLARAGMGTDVGVVDSTGEQTIFVGNFTQEMVGVFSHLSNGYFVDRAAASRIGFQTLSTLTFGLFLFDVDLDTDLDLFLANGHVQEHIGDLIEGATFAQPSQIFLNRGDGTFREMQSAGVLAREMVARGAAYADYDRDGDLDVLLTENDGSAHLWRNDLRDGRSLRIRLVGRESNRSALGSRVVAVVDGLRMERRVRAGSSYLSQSELTVTFGLGSHEEVDSLIVHWPSGRLDRFDAVQGGQELELIEGADRLRPSASARLTRG